MDDDVMADELRDARSALIHAENRADDLSEELGKANDLIQDCRGEIRTLEGRIAKLSEKINELYQMAD